MREKLKSNFLKLILIRFDYNGVLENSIDENIKNMGPFLNELKLDRLDKGKRGRLDINIGNPVDITNPVKINRDDESTVYTFTSELDRTISLQISKNDLSFQLAPNAEYDFDQYLLNVWEILKIILEHNEFHTLLRVGIRKINELIVLNDSDIGNYFDKNIFNLNDKIVSDKININACNSYKNYYFGENSSFVNLITASEKGKLKDASIASRCMLDIDGYSSPNGKIPENYMKILKGINDSLYLIFTKSITSEFLSKLKVGEDLDHTKVIGVRKNV